ncbi:MAG: hypothetical protein AB7O26_04210 [Planctomycetaceae bacterium]
MPRHVDVSAGEAYHISRSLANRRDPQNSRRLPEKIEIAATFLSV